MKSLTGGRSDRDGDEDKYQVNPGRLTVGSIRMVSFIAAFAALGGVPTATAARTRAGANFVTGFR